MKRLKEERVGFDNQLAAIERTLKAKEKDLEELVLMSHDAQHAKEVRTHAFILSAFDCVLGLSTHCTCMYVHASILLCSWT